MGGQFNRCTNLRLRPFTNLQPQSAVGAAFAAQPCDRIHDLTLLGGRRSAAAPIPHDALQYAEKR